MAFKPVHFPEHLYFVTGSLVEWQPLFAHRAYATIILNSLDWHRSHHHFALYTYVVMPTHFHIMIKPLDDRSISENLQSFGSFTAHAILKQLRMDDLKDSLSVFAQHRLPDSSEDHQIWQPMQAKNIFSREFLIQKLQYIHNNPIAKKWHLVSRRTEYPYSSACYYDEDKAPIVKVDDVRDLLV